MHLYHAHTLFFLIAILFGIAGLVSASRVDQALFTDGSERFYSL
jgi:hypothetical protein